MLTAEQLENWDAGVQMTDRGPWAQTASGARFYPLDPDPEDIHPADIAHHLALVNRFGGGTKYPYSVAQHLLLCGALAYDLYEGNRVVRRWALAHDMPEYMVGDMIRPVKLCLEPAYGDMEQRFMWAIAARFGLPSYDAETQDAVKRIDNLAAVIEAHHVLPEVRKWGGMPDYLPGYAHMVEPLTWWQARDLLARAMLEEGFV